MTESGQHCISWYLRSMLAFLRNSLAPTEGLERDTSRHAHRMIAARTKTFRLRPLCVSGEEWAQKLTAAFWPDPLTVIVPRRVAWFGHGHGHRVGRRPDQHQSVLPVAPRRRRVVDAVATLGAAGVSGPSANRFGRISSTTASRVHEEFGDAPIFRCCANSTPKTPVSSGSKRPPDALARDGVHDRLQRAAAA